jgi:hypothetical protein
MPLIDLCLPAAPAGVPGEVRSFLREAGRRIRRFQRHARVPGFVPADYEAAYGLLRAVAAAGLTRGNLFCEWGSGFGVVACLAAMLEFDACGIEVEPELVDAARRLADDFGLPVEFARGSFIPPGGEPRAAGGFAWLTAEADDTHQELGLGADDFDVIFAYPWPDEEGLTGDLFERYASGGALLLTYHGGEDFRLRRKRTTRFRTRARRPSGVKPAR